MANIKINKNYGLGQKRSTHREMRTSYKIAIWRTQSKVQFKTQR